MRAIVTSICTSEAGQQNVSLMTDYGALAGIWDGSLPEPSATVHLELEFIPDFITAEGAAASYSATSPSPNAVLLVGIAESWSDGVLGLRIGPSLVQVECMNEHESGSWLTMRGHDLRFFKTDL